MAEMALCNLKEIAVNAVYPVGSLYWSSNETSPADLFGVGTWTQIKDKFVLAAGDTYEAGAMGGEAEVTLTVDEMPKHGHSYNLHYGGVATSSNDLDMEKISGATYGASLGSKTYSNNILKSGGDQPHNNMPPYVVKYCWERTA